MVKPPRGQEAIRRRDAVLQLVRDASEPLSVAEIAEISGTHANTVRFHLDTLVANRQVERAKAESGTQGRPPQLYRLARGMDPMGERHYRALAEVLAVTVATDPDPSRRGVESGRLWGHAHASTGTDPTDRIHPTERTRLAERTRAAEKTRPAGPPPAGTAEAATVDLLVEMLDELGFAPERGSDGDHSPIDLRSCPFLELAVHHTDVVCPIHLGLMQGALAAWDSPLTVDRLDPFVEPDRCRAHLVAVDDCAGSSDAFRSDRP